MPEISAIIFDFDGVILDTETPLFEVWQEVFNGQGAVLDPAMWKQFIGSEFGAFDLYSHLEELSGNSVDRNGLRADVRGRYLAQVDANPVMPGIVDYISEARSMGLKVGVASSSDKAWVEGHLGERGLLDRFDAITTRDDVSKVKPDPELYLTAASMLDALPLHAVAIEDSLNGLNAAKGAGLHCVVVPNPMTADMDFGHADVRLNALSDLPLQSLLRRFSQAP